MTWTQALHDYKFYLQLERGMSSNSIKSYLLDVSKLVKYLKHHNSNALPLTINTDDIKPFIYTLSASLNERSQARLISGLRSFFEFLIFEDYITNNPIEHIESPKIGVKLPDTLSTDEIDVLISKIDLSHPQGERNRAIIELLYSCGLRVSELTNLKISDLFFNEGFINVTGKGNKQRFVPIDPQTQKYILIYKNSIRAHQNIPNTYQDILFLNRRGKQLTRAMIFTLVKQLAIKADIKKNISPHTFRHSFASHLLANGADLRSIQMMLGHESITTTEIYVHMDKSQLKNLINTFHPRNQKDN